MYRNDYDFSGECSKRGKFAEDEFIKAAHARRYKIRVATRKEQFNHIDYILKGLHPTSRKEIQVTVDVKSLKKKSRQSKNLNDKWVWLEMVNINGKRGWIYGKANFIAFERFNDFVVIKRDSLQAWVEASGRVRYDLPYVKNSWEAKYRVYSRPGRKDQITLVKMSDLLKLDACYIWEKEK